ncbi:MAG: tetratricopeptide repeat protein [Flavobacteriales bacterium]
MRLLTTMNCLIKAALSISLFIITGLLTAQSDSTGGSMMDQALITPRLIAARHEFNENNMRGSLTIYREVLQADPANAQALYGTAECHYFLKKYKLAEEYLDKAVAANARVSTETNLFYGQIYHRTAQLDKAISYYTKYLELQRPKTYEHEVAKQLIEQCQFAQEMMARPADVNIENMGEEINSRFDDYTPSITADGKLMVFTSRRSDTKGGAIDEAGDYKFFEDIYYSTWDDATKQWTRAQGVEGELNTETYDAVLSIMPDGNGMYVYKNTVTTTGDIYYSTYNKTDQVWEAAAKMPRPINTSYYEGSVSITADGNTLYFISEQPDGLGQGDIYVSTKKSGQWGSPKNIGAVLNTGDDEKFVFIHPNGKTLYFASNGHQTMGSYDIFKTEWLNGAWSVPVNLGYPINTVNEESTFSLTSDNKTMLIAAEYDNSLGERDIYKIDVSRYALIAAGYERSSFGQIQCNVEEAASGKAIKGAVVKVMNATSGRVITEVETDKAGQARVNVPGNFKYKIEVSLNGEEPQTFEVDLTLKAEGETVQKLSVKF